MGVEASAALKQVPSSSLSTDVLHAHRRLSAELVTAISIQLALCIPRCGCRTPCFSDVGLCGGGSGHRRSLCCTFCFHRSRSEATQGVSLSHVSEHALIPWAVPGYNFMEWVS